MVELYIGDGEGEGRRVQTATEDDFHYFRDSIQYALEPGGYGSRFPLFMDRFPESEWGVAELEGLLKELEAIAGALKELPPEPPDSNWQSKLHTSGRRCANLYEVFVDADGKPLLERLIDLCRTAQKEGKPVLIK